MSSLSICIPTHDGRAAVLDRLLERIAEQVDDPDLRSRVEVCVSDNGSRDQTTAVLERHAVSLPVPLRRHRFERNDGFTPNLLKVVEIAQCDYCWLIGSDDLIAPGAVAAVLRVLDDHPGTAGVTLNRYRVDLSNPGVKHFDPADELPEDPGSVHEYITAHEAFVNVGLSQDFISTQVFSRELFLEVAAATTPGDLEQSGHFAHLLLLGRVIQRRPHWVWYPEAVVEHTTGTSALDEDLDHDYTKYQLAVMEGRDAVWAMLFGRGSPTYEAVMLKAYRRTANPTAVVTLKFRPNHGYAQDLALLRAFVGYFRRHRPFWRSTFPVLLIPHALVKWKRSRRLGRDAAPEA